MVKLKILLLFSFICLSMVLYYYFNYNNSTMKTNHNNDPIINVIEHNDNNYIIGSWDNFN